VIVAQKMQHAMNQKMRQSESLQAMEKLQRRLINGKVDSFAANGGGDIKVSGNLHLADEFNHLFDRVGFYLK